MKSTPLKMKIPESLKALPRISFCDSRKYSPCFPEANPLLIFCEDIVDFESEPSFWNLTPEEIGQFVANKLNNPELKEAFIVNEIRGKDLVFLEADNLPKISIRWFDVIKASWYRNLNIIMVCIIEKELTAEIRRLCKIEMEDPNRGKSLPYRLPNTLFMFYKASRTGPTAYYMTMSQYFRKIHIIRDETTEDRRYYALLNHWHRIPPYRPWCPHVLVGGIRRINPMTGTTQRQIQKPGNCKCNCKRDEIPCVLGM